MHLYQKQRRQRGNVIVEFGLAFPLLFVFLGGMFQFGFAFFVYNQLQSAVRTGVRFASTYDFDSQNNGDNFRTAVRNMVVYGTPTAGSVPVVNGLTTGNVNVTWAADGAGVPQTVTVNISAFTFYAVWGSFTLSNKPRSTFIYLGQFLS
jgi:Flp pilus assembly protein TadG